MVNFYVDIRILYNVYILFIQIKNTANYERKCPVGSPDVKAVARARVCSVSVGVDWCPGIQDTAGAASPRCRCGLGPCLVTRDIDTDRGHVAASTLQQAEPHHGNHPVLVHPELLLQG